MNKKLSYKWAFATAVLFLFLEIILIALGLTLDIDVTFSDYFAFFIAGLIVGAALVYLLKRCPTKTAVRGTMIGFVIGIVLALTGIFLGAPSGTFGTVLFGISPNIFAMMIGYIVGRLSGKKK